MLIQTKLLVELLAATRLPASRFSPRVREALRTPFDAGLLARRRQGAGEIIEVVDPERFQAWLTLRFPGLFGAGSAPGPRSANLLRGRDSKRGRRGLDRFTVLARAHGVPSGLEPGPREAFASLAAATAHWGAAALVLTLGPGAAEVAGPALPPGLRVMTIENPETFHHSERLRDEADLFLLPGTGGRMREAFILWLAAQPGLCVTHFGDYDPVGLQEFTRLLARMPGRVSLRHPEDLEDAFRRYANRGLLDAPRNRAILAGLPRGLSPALDRLLELLANHGPLEQEALLIEPGPGLPPKGNPHGT